MVKVFDHQYPKRGWKPFPSFKAARGYIDQELESEIWVDTDRSFMRVIELHDNGTTFVYALEHHGWYEGQPDYQRYEAFLVHEWPKYSDHPLTTLNPRVDYIFV